MQFLYGSLTRKFGAVSSSGTSRGRSSMSDPGKNRSYAKVSKQARTDMQYDKAKRNFRDKHNDNVIQLETT